MCTIILKRFYQNLIFLSFEINDADVATSSDNNSLLLRSLSFILLIFFFKKL